ncbi:hypothetical protein QUF90_21260 [Desulfococcaceae bacterium HSG9]|nr:hypothetical protein [Desulfococcaceae bacterium HSG9]
MTEQTTKIKHGDIRISTRIMAITSLIFALAAIVMICLVNYGMKQAALNNARLKARIILDQNLAIHTYFSRNLKPILLKHNDVCMADGYFEPVWMSSTFAVCEINKYFRSSATDEYYYKAGHFWLSCCNR